MALGSPASASEIETSQTLEQLNQYSLEGTGSALSPVSNSTSELVTADTEAAQVTSVSQLSDVRPTDWAFQALQSLVERYGVIAGYPDGTFRGNRALTRYEFAAGLNAALDRVNELIAAGLADKVSREDLATLQRLQEQFAAELATLRGRVDSLEARTAELEANQFSTTTKLNALAWFNFTGASADGTIRAEGNDAFTAARTPPDNRAAVRRIDEDPNVIFSSLVWLTLNTSFTGKDNLITQLAFSDAGLGSPANLYVSGGLYNTWGTPFTDQIASDAAVDDRRVILRELAYDFPIFGNGRLVIGPRVNWYRYFDGNRFTFFLTGAGSFNSSGSTLLNTIDRGAGAVAILPIGEQFDVRVGYLAENNEFLPASLGYGSASRTDQGLFSGTNTLTAQLTYSPSNNFGLRLIYNRLNIQPIFGQIGGATGEPIYGLADGGANPITGVGIPLNDSSGHAFAVSLDWLITPGFGIFGRYTYGSVELDRVGFGSRGLNSQSYQVGLAFPDLFKPGALAVLTALVPFSVTRGQEFLVSGFGDGGKQYDIELSYFLPLTDNIAIVPSFYAIIHPNNFDSNPAVYVGNLRTQFSF
ncbi:carbohydrate porin [Leptolyngbya sp. FACHB-261]|nr:carbohydrate porin [Leptolyngbya sp. FACHB-261]